MKVSSCLEKKLYCHFVYGWIKEKIDYLSPNWISPTQEPYYNTLQVISHAYLRDIVIALS